MLVLGLGLGSVLQLALQYGETKGVVGMYLPNASETGEWVTSGFKRALQRRVSEGQRKKLQIKAADESCGRKICAVNQRAQTVKVNVKVKQGCTSCPGSP